MTATGVLPPADLSALRQLVDAYADAVDAKDIPTFLSLFAADGEVRVQPEDGPVESRFKGPDLGQAIETLASFHRTFHHVGGAVFEPDSADADRARGRVHCSAHHYDRTTNGPVDLVMMIRYLDRFHRVDGRWLIEERQVVIDWTELHPAHPARRAGRPVTQSLPPRT